MLTGFNISRLAGKLMPGEDALCSPHNPAQPWAWEPTDTSILLLERPEIAILQALCC